MSFDSKKLKNGKFFAGSFKGFSATKGWFLGSFFGEESPLKTDQIEVLYKEHQAGGLVKPHFHKHKVELLIFLEGRARYVVNDKPVDLSGGDFLFVDVNNIISGEFLAPSKIFAIHSPSLPEDKLKT